MVEITPDSLHHRILKKLCAMPRATRGMTGVMLNREFKAPRAIEELFQAGLIRGRDWHETMNKVPIAMWVPTEKGEALCRRFSEAGD